MYPESEFGFGGEKKFYIWSYNILVLTMYNRGSNIYSLSLSLDLLLPSQAPIIIVICLQVVAHNSKSDIQ